jgi:aryl-alcohol dehydrogenase-like predicted oxidoreductase
MANMEEIVLATKVHFPMGDGPDPRKSDKARSMRVG